MSSASPPPAPSYPPVLGCPSPFTGGTRPPRGTLQFDCAFESGNLGAIERIEGNEYELSIRPDTHSTRHAVWWYFRVSNVRVGQRVIFHINNYSKKKSLFREGFTPIVRTTTKTQWERINTKNLFFYRCPRHHPRFCINLTYCFERERTSSGAEEEYFFAFSYPYTYSDLQRYLSDLDTRYSSIGIFRRNVLTQTVEGRDLDLICITSSDNMKQRKNDTTYINAAHAGRWVSATAAAAATAASSAGATAVAASSSSSSPARTKHCVFLTARVHPGESPSSYMCVGIIDFLLSDDPVARLLREHCIFYIVPMLNPDGVVHGNYRTNLLGYDLNREWLDPSRQEQPTILATKCLLLSLAADTSITLDYFLDLHAHTSSMSCFLFCNHHSPLPSPTTSSSLPRVEDLPRLLDSHSPHFSLDKTRLLAPDLAHHQGTGRRAMGDFLIRTLCYTIEVSFFCGFKGGQRSLPFTQRDFIEMGRSLTATLQFALKLVASSNEHTIIRQPTLTVGGTSMNGATIMRNAASGGANGTIAHANHQRNTHMYSSTAIEEAKSMDPNTSMPGTSIASARARIQRAGSRRGGPLSTTASTLLYPSSSSTSFNANLDSVRSIGDGHSATGRSLVAHRRSASSLSSSSSSLHRFSSSYLASTLGGHSTAMQILARHGLSSMSIASNSNLHVRTNSSSSKGMLSFDRKGSDIHFPSSSSPSSSSSSLLSSSRGALTRSTSNIASTTSLTYGRSKFM